MREASHNKTRTVATPIIQAVAICQNGGVCETMRTIIVMGEKNGTIETQNAKDELGARITGNAMYSPAINRNTTGIAICPPSCVVVTIEPMSTVAFSRGAVAHVFTVHP